MRLANHRRRPPPLPPAAQDPQHDVTIFSLAVLLCSTLIYNEQGAIDEDSIASLGFIAGCRSDRYMPVTRRATSPRA